MIVLKFGGASLKDAETIGRVESVIRSRLEQQPAIIVSACGSTTDKLCATLDALASGHTDTARDLVTEIERDHLKIIEDTIEDDTSRRQANEILENGLARLNRLVDGMDCLGEVSPRSRDALLSFGELTSAPLLSQILSARGVPATMVDPRRVIITDGDYCEAAPIMQETERRCRETIAPLLEANRIPIMGGFVGATAEGITTTLGRGGSDFTASLVAGALQASMIEYWKDADGILTADPSLVPEARTVPLLTYQEAGELAFLGARVLHPASIQPAVDARIPVRVLNLYEPENLGTLITETVPAVHESAQPPEEAVSSVACKRNQVMLGIYSTRMLGATGFLRRVFEVFDRLSLSVDHIATSEVSVTVTMNPTELIEELKAELREVAEVEVEHDIGVVSVVGMVLSRSPGVAAKIFGALRNHNIKLITYGGSGVNLSLVVRDNEVPRAVQSLHSELCGERTRSD